MRHSALVLGLSSEERESALRQVRLWDEMTVGTGLRRTLLRHLRKLRRQLEGSAWPQGPRGNFQKAHEEFRCQLREALKKLQGRLQDAPETEPAWMRGFTHPLDPQAMKLCRLLAQLEMPITAIPVIGTLHVAGRKIEERAIDDVRKAQRQRDAAGSQIPVVETIHDLARYVLCRLFTDLDDWLSKASPEERERVAKGVAEALDQLGPDVQEEVRRVTGLDVLTIVTLLRTGRLAALASALLAAGGVGGFAVYAMLTATIAGAAGSIGLTLPFSVYVTASSLLAGITNPLVVLGVAVGGGTWLVKSANTRMHAELLPLLVAFAAAKAEDTAEVRSRVRDLAGHLAYRYQEFVDGGPKRRAQLLRAFPAFRAPKENHRAEWSLGRLRPYTFSSSDL